ncbi:PHP domain-containing protein [Alkalibacter mobilis]|uniref:PHP domain-containing protein n=1 Tax=Alkalibacter mobilis TaxID=2787712 RepID=UPI00189F3629|nr:PHP domain-containing protein [Alkalibacter mobilis]MBF7095720.1 PHP domain-containing protein [Alkalibacter mobilis]
MNNYADLHIHSCFSDGVLTPEEILTDSKKKNLRAIAVTDHDTFEGSSRAFKLSASYGIEVLMGIELSCSFEDQDIHLLGYFKEDVSHIFKPFLYKLKQGRIERAYKISDRFKNHGIAMPVEEMVINSESIGRPHFAKELIKKGIVGTFEEAFEKYLSRGKSCYVEKTKLPVLDAISEIRKYGGVSIIAHPALIRNKLILNELISLNPDGLEVYHSKHTQEDKIYLYNLAKDHGLLVSGGSDFHEETKYTTIGSVKLPYYYLENIKEKLY